MSVVNLHELASSATENHDAVHAILLALLSIKKLSVLTPTEVSPWTYFHICTAPLTLTAHRVQFHGEERLPTRTYPKTNQSSTIFQQAGA